MIRLENIGCGYGKKLILTDVDLSIKPGELTCILGKNGAGKTTLFKTILGFLKPFQGAVFVNDKKLNSYSNRELAKEISYVPQAHGTPFPFPVFDVIMMGQHIHTKGYFGIPGKKNREIVANCIDLLEIGHLRNKSFSKLSGGEKQLVLIARAMAQQPTFIAMDEPTSNLDLGNQAKVMQAVCRLRDQGFGIIMNTHQPEQAVNNADQVILLKNGKVNVSGHPDSVLGSVLLSEIYETKIELHTAVTAQGALKKVFVTV